MAQENTPLDQQREIAILRSRIRDLEHALRLTDNSLTTTFRLAPALSALLGLLMSLPLVSPELIRQRLEVVTDPKVAMHRLRKALAEWDITIHSKRVHGYWLDVDTKMRIEELVTSKVTPTTKE